MAENGIFLNGSSQHIMNGFFNCFLYRFDILFKSKLLFTHDNNKRKPRIEQCYRPH